MTETSKPPARKGLALLAMVAVLLEGGIILHHVHTVRMLPLWSYFAFLGVLCVFWFSVWTLATGTLPGWATLLGLFRLP